MKDLSSRIVTYSLLAHINDHNEGIKDLCDLFVPLVKRILAQMASEGVTKGAHVNEIKQRIDKAYFLDIPFPLLSKILSRIAKEIESQKGSTFVLYRDQAFSINNYTFYDFDEEIGEEEANIERIEDLYKTYLEINGIKNFKEVSLFEFIDKNRTQLISYFSSSYKPTTNDKDFTVQANFINNIKSDKNLFKIICKIYLGSIIVSYLEFEPEKSTEKGDKEFLIDTNFVIGLLDLNTIESTHTCRKIVEICNRLGYRISILDLTIEETKNLIERAANSLDTTFLQKKLDPDSIFNACDRRKLSKTDLEKTFTNLTHILQTDFAINLVYDSTKYKNEAKHSKEYEIYKTVRSTEMSALHDATVIKYVQKKRVGLHKDYFSSNCFFVTNTARDSKPLLESQSVSEIIRAEDLVNILWLTNPNVKLNLDHSEVVSIGLSRLISSTLNSKLPSSRIIHELDVNIQKYAKDAISDKDIIRVANRIADKTLTNLDQLNKLAKESPRKFVQRLNSEARIEEQRQRKFVESLRLMLTEIKDSTDEKVKAKERLLKQEYETALEKTRVEVGDHISQVSKSYEQIIIDTKKENFKQMQQAKETYDALASRRALLIMALTVIPPVIILLLIYFFFDNSILEVVSLIGIFLWPIITFTFYAYKKKEWSIKEIHHALIERYKIKYYKKFNFDKNYYNKIQQEIESNNKPQIKLD